MQTRIKYWPHNCPMSASKGCISSVADRSRYSNASSLPFKVLDIHSLFHGLLLLLLRSAKVWRNAASSIAPDVLDEVHTPDKMVLFAADDVDHNIVTLDGKGTFHGMGMLAVVTPGNEVTHTVLRRKLSDLNSIDQTKVDIVEHRFARQALSSVKFQPLPNPRWYLP